MCKQIIFHVFGDDKNHAGILLESGDVVCGCCGATIKKGKFFTIRNFDDWMNLEAEIIGDDEMKEGYNV